MWVTHAINNIYKLISFLNWFLLLLIDEDQLKLQLKVEPTNLKNPVLDADLVPLKSWFGSKLY